MPNLRDTFERMRDASRLDPYPEANIRIDRLLRLEKGLLDYKKRLLETMSEDFSYRSVVESNTFDITSTLGEIRHMRRHTKKWMKSRSLPTPKHLLPAKVRILPQPLGVVGVISPWNFPIFLALGPAANAFAAGNRVMLKPSELTPQTSSLLEEMARKYFTEDEFLVVTGDAKLAAEFSALPFDHLIFTGSTAVGRKVAVAAANNLTPCTLELGGKSPAIITEGANLEQAAERIAWGKFTSAGQVCVAPDYALVPRHLMDEFVNSLKGAVRKFYPDGIHSEDYSAIISERHFERLEQIKEDAKLGKAKVIEIGADDHKTQSRKIVPTLIIDPDENSQAMREEIFGPILAILPYDRRDEALAFITARDRPLVLYIFGKAQSEIDFWLYKSIAGGTSINETLLHVGCSSLPFGGVGASGSGAYHGEKGFETFSHMKSIFVQPKINAGSLLTPPFTDLKQRIGDLIQKFI